MPPRVKLSAIVDAMDMQFDETHALLDKQTGEVIVLSDEELRAAEDGEDAARYPEWQRDNIERAKAVQADDGKRFLELPGRFEINEWDMMRDFALGLDNEAHAEMLLKAIDGKGAFRYFKDRIHELGLADAWYKFRDRQYRQAALDWCEAKGIEVDPDA
jgi:hypothetical protein